MWRGGVSTPWRGLYARGSADTRARAGRADGLVLSGGRPERVGAEQFSFPSVSREGASL
jgi:hypothetical protein